MPRCSQRIFLQRPSVASHHHCVNDFVYGFYVTKKIGICGGGCATLRISSSGYQCVRLFERGTVSTNYRSSEDTHANDVRRSTTVAAQLDGGLLLE